MVQKLHDKIRFIIPHVINIIATYIFIFIFHVANDRLISFYILHDNYNALAVTCSSCSDRLNINLSLLYILCVFSN